jgi:hypothetical protein
VDGTLLPVNVCDLIVEQWLNDSLGALSKPSATQTSRGADGTDVTRQQIQEFGAEDVNRNPQFWQSGWNQSCFDSESLFSRRSGW